MNTDGLSNLNEKQYKVATTVNGVLRTIAGPGTGKTNTQTSQISYLIQQGIPP
ncbi:MAG: UvrD-helicase domain-containing protein, partial [Endozoicomonadaceae bacterium]|nr:UvrD-helicase domain-containing protein [Endozoicomonadaceae bacterium]